MLTVPKTKKSARVLTGLMLTAFALLVCAGMLLGAFRSRSYSAAFALAAVIFVGVILLRKRLSVWAGLLENRDSLRLGAVLALICLLVHLTWVLLVRMEPTVDYLTFWNSAVDLAEGREPRSAEYLALFPHILGYAAFLSVFLRLFGTSWFIAPAVNVVLTVVSGILLYVLCLRWRDKRTATLAFALWIVCPSKILYNTMVLSEPLYTCLILCFVLLVSELERRGHSQAVLCLGAVGSALVLRGINAARPIAAIPIIAFFIWLFLLRADGGEGPSLRRWMAYGLLTMLLYMGLGLLWDRYAENVVGEELPQTPGYSLYVGFNPQSNGSYSEEDMQLLFHYRYDVYGNAKEAQAQMLEEAKARIKSGDVHFPRLFVKKVQTFLGDDEGGAYYSAASLGPMQYSVCAVISNVYYYALVMLALLGVRSLWRERVTSCVLMLPLYVLGLTLAHMLVEVAGRYHYSVIPMLVIMAAFSCGGKGDTNHV